VSTTHGRENYPIFDASICTLERVVAFFLDECGIDINMAAPRKKTTLLQPFRPPSKIKSVRLPKYLVEEKGADITFYHAVIAVNKTFLDNFLSLEAGTPMSVTDLAPSDEWDSAWERGGLSRPDKDMEAFSMRKGKEIETKARERQEAEAAKALFKEQKTKAKEATAALLAELDAEDRQAAAAAAKRKSKKKGNKKKGAGSQQQQAAPIAPGDTAAGRGGRLEECKADDIRLAPQLSPQVEDEQKQQRQRAPQDAADAGAAVVAVNMGNLSLEERKALMAPRMD